MPKIYISTDEWYPWFDHGVPTDRYVFNEDELYEVSQSQLDRLDELAGYVKEYNKTLADLLNRKSLYEQ